MKIFQHSKWFAYFTTKKSENAKTGDMHQIGFLHSDMIPTECIKQNADVEICKGCHLRGAMCYVNPVTLNQKWRKFAPMPVDKPIVNKPIRFGEYGNPSLLPLNMIRDLVNAARKVGRVTHTGYFHDWLENPKRRQYGKYFMASVDEPTAHAKGMSVDQLYAKAKSYGLRTFRILKPGDCKHQNEIECPYPRVQCKDCGLCSGTQHNSQKDIVVQLHGSPIGVNRFLKITEII